MEHSPGAVARLGRARRTYRAPFDGTYSALPLEAWSWQAQRWLVSDAPTDVSESEHGSGSAGRVGAAHEEQRSLIIGWAGPHIEIIGGDDFDLEHVSFVFIMERRPTPWTDWLRNHPCEDGTWRSLGVALIPEPDNDYNGNAVTVALPDTSLPRASRDLAYLPDPLLEELGWGVLPALAGVASQRGGEVRCLAYVSPEDSLYLAIAATLRRDAEKFLSEQGVSHDLSVDPDSEAQTAAILAATTAQHERGHIGAITMYVDEEPEGFGRVIKLVTDGGRDLGSIDDDLFLTLVDERDRAAVLGELASRDIRARPMQAPHPAAGGASAPQNLRLVGSGGGGVFMQPLSGVLHERRLGGYMAYFNPKTATLWVEDARLVPTAATFAARGGLAVARVRTPEVPWRVEAIADYEEVLGHGVAEIDFRVPEPRPDAVPLLDRHRDGAPSGLLDGLVAWLNHPRSPRRHVSLDRHLTFETLAAERAILFPGHAQAEGYAACRLCGLPTISFTFQGCSEDLAYCQECMEHALNGVATSVKKTAQAVKRLAELEFGGVPMVPSQLGRVHLDVSAPSPALDVDQLVLLRLAICRGHPWTHVLLDSTLSPGGVRTTRGTIVKANDGHTCLSLQEKAVCEFLHSHGIEHDREPFYPRHEILNPGGRWRADWQLADGTLVEMWGMVNDPAYAARMSAKQELARELGLDLVELEARDIPHLEARFAPWLSRQRAR